MDAIDFEFIHSSLMMKPFISCSFLVEQSSEEVGALAQLGLMTKSHRTTCIGAWIGFLDGVALCQSSLNNAMQLVSDVQDSGSCLVCPPYSHSAAHLDPTQVSSTPNTQITPYSPLHLQSKPIEATGWHDCPGEASGDAELHWSFSTTTDLPSLPWRLPDSSGRLPTGLRCHDLGQQDSYTSC